MRRKSLLFCLILLATCLPAQADEFIQDGLITQTSGNYLYWNAEDFDRLVSPGDNSLWGINFNPPAISLSGKTLIAPSANDTPGDNDSLVIYNLDFTDPGDYTFYAFRVNGEGDSMFPPPDFNADPFHDPTFGNSVNRWNGIDSDSWNELGDSGCCDFPGNEYFASGVSGTYNVGAPGVVEFRIEAREQRAQYDRFVLHKTKGLSSADLHALTFSGSVVNNPLQPPPPIEIPLSSRALLPGHGQVGDGVNGSWWKQSSDNSLANAQGIIAGGNPDATFTATQLDYPRGPDNGSGSGTEIGVFLSPDALTFSPGSSSDASTSSNDSVWSFDGFIDILDADDIDPVLAGIQVSFGTPSDDATNVVIGGVELLNNDGGHGFPGGGAGPQLVTFEDAGMYPISMILTQGGGGFGIELHSSIAGTDVGSFSGLANTPSTERLFTAAVPEPSTFLLSMLGLLGFAGYLWRRKS